MNKISKRLSIDELREIVAPIAERHGVERIVLFGSAARGEAGSESDYDFCVDKGSIRSLFELGHLCMDLRAAVGGEIDVVSRSALESGTDFLRNVERDGVTIYER
ncbi:MAG: nucleotidyltransferase domain-containing protein [Candidatus Methanoplasma sp.]|jgi:predicted nucleotidyltransferase|nr:nucleotidyltransferase domain-containing protein [Candidatus Methanoplasma sp.]